MGGIERRMVVRCKCENFAVTAAALARRIERIASEADRVARGEIERETQTIKVKLPPFVSERLESVAQKLDDTIVQDPTLPDIPKPDWFTGQGEYSEGIWSDRIGKDYKEQIRNIRQTFCASLPKTRRTRARMTLVMRNV